MHFRHVYTLHLLGYPSYGTLTHKYDQMDCKNLRTHQNDPGPCELSCHGELTNSHICSNVYLSKIGLEGLKLLTDNILII